MLAFIAQYCTMLITLIYVLTYAIRWGDNGVEALPYVTPVGRKRHALTPHQPTHNTQRNEVYEMSSGAQEFENSLTEHRPAGADGLARLSNAQTPRSTHDPNAAQRSAGASEGKGGGVPYAITTYTNNIASE